MSSDLFPALFQQRETPLEFILEHSNRKTAMTITIDPKTEARFRARADAAALTVEAYIERLPDARESAVDEPEGLALEGLNSGEPIEAGPGYWEEKHHRPDVHLRRADRH
jgi:hypothetical protein